MISNAEARALLNAIETYGDRERHYGRELNKHEHGESAYGVLSERNKLVTGELDEVKRLLGALIDDRDGIDEIFDAPDRGSMHQEDELPPEPKWLFED